MEIERTSIKAFFLKNRMLKDGVSVKGQKKYCNLKIILCFTAFYSDIIKTSTTVKS